MAGEQEAERRGGPPEARRTGGCEIQQHGERDHAADLADEPDQREAGIIDRLYRLVGRLVEPELARQFGDMRERRAELGGDEEQAEDG